MARNTSGHRCERAGFSHIQFLESHKQDMRSVAKSPVIAVNSSAGGGPAKSLTGYWTTELRDGAADF